MKHFVTIETFTTVVQLLGGERFPGEIITSAHNGILAREIQIGESFRVELRVEFDNFAKKGTALRVKVNWPSIGSVPPSEAIVCAETMRLAATQAASIQAAFAGREFWDEQIDREQAELSEVLRNARETIPEEEITKEKLIQAVRDYLES